MSLVRSMIAQALNLHPAALAPAFKALESSTNTRHYLDTPERRQRLALLNAAGAMGVPVRLGFLKQDGSLRYMQALPVVDGDPTAQYATVLDLELSESAVRKVYRRVILDTLVAASVDFRQAA